MKQKNYIHKSSFIYLLFLLVTCFGMEGCNSEENFSKNGNANTKNEVSFSTEATMVKKIMYGTNTENSIPVYWSQGDQIKIYSPASPENQLASYKTIVGSSESSEQATFSIENGETSLQWNSEGNSQSFYSFYPSSAVSFSQNNGLVAATATLPSSQDGKSTTNCFMAAYKKAQANPVQLDFIPLMNTLRLKITDNALGTDENHTINAIVIKSKEDTPKNLAGGMVVNYPTGDSGNPSVTQINGSSDSILITGVALSSIDNGTLNILAYLLPQNYGKLKVSVYTAGGKKFVAKTAFASSSFAASTICDLTFGSLEGLIDVPHRELKADLGCPVGGDNTTSTSPLYFGTGDLIVSSTGKARLADNAKAEYSVTADASGSYSTTDAERDIFRWGDITGWSLSTNSNELYPTNISNLASYDAARALLGGTWRIPTQAEWQWIINNCTKEWITQNGMNGLLITGSKNTSNTYDKKDHSAGSIFLPAIGIIYWDKSIQEHNTSMSRRWSITLKGKKKEAFYEQCGAGYMSVNSSAALYVGYPIRPVCE